MAHHAGNQDLAIGHLDVAKHLPLVLMAHVAGLDRIALRLHLEQKINNIFERHVAIVRPMPAAPADVETNAVFGNSLERVVHGLDLESGPLAVACHVAAEREPPVVNINQRRIVDLDDEPCINNCLVFLVDRLGQGPGIVFAILVVLVRQDLQRGRRRPRS